jgi:hypothetical protein
LIDLQIVLSFGGIIVSTTRTRRKQALTARFMNNNLLPILNEKSNLFRRLVFMIWGVYIIEENKIKIFNNDW